jgi:isocitrate dehydrogenase kinase/phosphatase
MSYTIGDVDKNVVKWLKKFQKIFEVARWRSLQGVRYNRVHDYMHDRISHGDALSKITDISYLTP